MRSQCRNRHAGLSGALLVLLLGMTPFFGALQAATWGKISGKITDARSREPLLGANVIIVESHLGAVTDLSGDYFIANVPTGVYQLKVSMVGYKGVTAKEVVVRINRTTEINFSLEQSVIAGEDIVITAERPLVEKDNTSSNMILASQEIISRPTTEFMDVLTTLPSINVEDGVLKFRGGTLDQVAFMIDGTRAQNPMNHSPYTNINLSSIAEVEVITGSFNAEYGEAMSGVVNVVTKEGSDRYSLFIDSRYTPPGKRHWGDALYDLSSDLYWENSHARHLQWWVENTDQWVDPAGAYGYDPSCNWTPEQAWNNYLKTHQPLTDYTKRPSYQTEISFGGPVPMVKGLSFFATGKLRSQAPVMGNAYRDEGRFFDGTLKLSYQLAPSMKVTFSGFGGKEESCWGMDWVDSWYSQRYGLNARYAYYDFAGLPTNSTDGQTLTFHHLISPKTMYEVKLNRVHAKRKTWTFPDDPVGWESTEAIYDYLRATDENGYAILGGYMNAIGYHTLGYYYRFDDDNTEYNLTGFLGSNINKYWYLKAGLDLSYYNLDHFNQSKAPNRRDDRTYNPWQGALYWQNKLEFGGLIMNAGLRFDFYNPNDYVYTNVFDPLNSDKKKTKIFTQLSPRLGISHPIDERTVLHFSYGHFFQRSSFGDYGEGNDSGDQQGSLTTFIIDGTNYPWVLGNREVRPLKTISYEVGLERNFADQFVIDITGYYKDIRNTIRTTTIESPYGIYTTNGNGNYADVRGVELSLRKVPSVGKLGAVWGYVNFTTQIGIYGSSGDPDVIRYDGTVRYPASGDVIAHNNPRLKAGISYQTPGGSGGVGRLLNKITMSLNFEAVYPNDKIRTDYFLYNGKRYMRSADKRTAFRLKKEIVLPAIHTRINPYLEAQNIFNNKWLNLQTFENASFADQEKFATSGFSYIPDRDMTGAPILAAAQYRNLPRVIMFGATVEF